MRASEIITELTKRINLYGDLEVAGYDIAGNETVEIVDIFADIDETDPEKSRIEIFVNTAED